LNRVGVVDEN